MSNHFPRFFFSLTLPLLPPTTVNLSHQSAHPHTSSSHDRTILVSPPRIVKYIHDEKLKILDGDHKNKENSISSEQLFTLYADIHSMIRFLSSLGE